MPAATAISDGAGRRIIAELAGLAIGVGLGHWPGARRRGLDLAALLRVLDAVPGLREQLDVELLLRLGEGVGHGLLRGLGGPLVSLLELTLVVPDRPPARGTAGRARPAPFPAGAIERYAEMASLLAFAAFGLGLLTTRDLEGSAAALLAGLPRPALLARAAFVAEIGRRLAAEACPGLDLGALERLDRIDALVIDRPLLAGPWGAALQAAAREAGPLRVVAVDPGEAAVAAVLSLQADGHGVMVLAEADGPAIAAADVGVGALEAAWLLLPACGAARRCARQGIQVSLVTAVVGLALGLEGVNPSTTVAVNQASHLLAVVAIGNGLRLARQLDGTPPQPAVDPVPWHALEVAEVLERLGVAANGRPPDPTPAPRRLTLGRLLLEELDNPLVPVLAIGAGLSALLSSPVDAALIVGVVGVNALIGADQRRRVEQAVAALQQRTAAPAWVKRGGAVERIDASRLVIGDTIQLETGEVVPADGRILTSVGLQVDESVLTGESFPVAKGPEACAAGALAERTSMVHAGTTVVSGTATAVVVAVGEATEARRGLAAVGAVTGAGGVEGRLQSLTELTAPIAALSGLAVLLSALVRQRDPRTALGEGVALAVAAVPEGLPILASLAQFAAAGRLSGEKVFVRNPRAIESLGRVTVICLDKTGTLTSGRIALVEVSDGQRTMALEPLDRAGFRVLRVALWATPTPEAGRPLAHPTDRGLREGALRVGVSGEGWERLATLPFEPARGYHASLGRRKGRCLLCVKGSPEIVLAASNRERTAIGPVPIDAVGRERLEAIARDLARRGLRVLAVARRVIDDTGGLADDQVCDLEFVGFVGLADPIRATAKQALVDLQRAGIAVKIITGDHPATAMAIAAELALPSDGTVLTGPMLEVMDDATLAQAVLSASVFARVTSLQKLQLVRALQQAGQRVAMTGDGANDAPAIRRAEVGIALGSRATDAARSAADIIVTDGRLETIVRAVLEGRALWRSVRDAVGLLVGGNLGEIGFTLLSGLVEGRSPLNTRQLLLMNLLTDVAPALAIAMRPPGQLDPEELLREGPDASLGQTLDREILRTAAITSLTSAMARSFASLTGGRSAADTVGLLTLVGTQLGQGMASRRVDGLTLLTCLGSLGGLVATVQTPGLSQAFGCRPLGPLGLLQAGAATIIGTGLGVVLPFRD